MKQVVHHGMTVLLVHWERYSSRVKMTVVCAIGFTLFNGRAVTRVPDVAY
jgi:hypothetical protein